MEVGREGGGGGKGGRMEVGREGGWRWEGKGDGGGKGGGMEEGEALIREGKMEGLTTHSEGLLSRFLEPKAWSSFVL